MSILGQLRCGLAGVVKLAGQLAQLSLVTDQLGRQKARRQSVLEADRILALALLTHLKRTIRNY